MISFLKKHLPLILLSAIIALISVRNYIPGTWLTGWDNLHTEFNFPLNIYRSIYGVWQEYQSFGLLAGMAHAADLPRQLFLFASSLFIPASFMRYFYQFLMLFVGTIGVYVLSTRLVFNSLDDSHNKWGGWFAALFYLLNLGTIQYFFVPFEPYSTFWGMFPWSILSFILYLERPSKKNLLFFALVTVAAIPQAVVQTVFLVYLMCLSLLALSFVLKKHARSAIITSIIALSVVILVNSFWLFPNLYFTATNVKVTQNAINNKINNDRFFEINKRRGTLADFAMLKEFYFDFTDYGSSQQDLQFMMGVWRKHTDTILVTGLGFLFFSFICIGLFQKNKYRRFLVPLFALSAVALLSDTLGFSLINSILRSIPIVNQIFRNPFTKFIVPAILSFSIFFSIGVVWFITKMETKLGHKVRMFVGILCTAAVIFYALPIFQGKLFYDKLRLKIPQKYFDTFSYFNSQDPNGRIMNLPQDSYWGWGYYDWGSRGSGFLWYGIPQPIVDRAFDVWSQESEAYYWELSYALKKNDGDLLNKILQKYNITYVLFDSSYTPSESMPYKLLVKENDLLANNSLLTLEKEFDTISIYKVKKNSNNVAFFSPALPSVAKSGLFKNTDEAFTLLGTYAEKKPQNNSDYIFPFQSLFSNRFSQENPIEINEYSDHFELKSEIPSGEYSLHIPSSNQHDSSVPYSVFVRQEGTFIYVRLIEIQPDVFIGDNRIETLPHIIELRANNPGDAAILAFSGKEFLTLPTINSSYTYVGNIRLEPVKGLNVVSVYSRGTNKIESISPALFSSAHECNTAQAGETKSVAQHDELVIETKNKPACVTYKNELRTNDQRTLFKLSFDYKSETDEFPQFCLYSTFENNCLNRPNQTLRSSSESYTSYSEFMESKNTSPDSLYLNLGLDPQKSKIDQNQKRIAYKNIQIESYPLNSSTAFDLVDTKNEFVSLIKSDKKTHIKILVQKMATSDSIPELVASHMFKLSDVAHNELMSDNFSISAEKGIRLSVKDTTLNFWFTVPYLPSKSGYLLSIQEKKEKGFPSFLNISSVKDKKRLLTTLLNEESQTKYFVLPPYGEFDEGIQILFSVNSFNNHPTEVTIDSLKITPLPYEMLSHIFLKKSTSNFPPTNIETYPDVDKKSLSSYIVRLTNNNEGVIVLSQAFSPGWTAYADGKKINDHFLVNGWANGWQISASSTAQTITLVFWPQYLEFAGFFLLVVTFGAIVLIPEKKRNHTPFP